jgi:hypothetical protein
MCPQTVRCNVHADLRVQVPKDVLVWCPSPHQSPIACSRRSSHASLLRVQTLCHHIPLASTTRYKDYRRSCMIQASARVTPAHPWRSPACHPELSDGERRFMPVLLPGIDVPSRRLTRTDDRSASTWFPEFDRRLVIDLGVHACFWAAFRFGSDILSECGKSGSR